RRLVKSIKPGGRVVIIDFKSDSRVLAGIRKNSATFVTAHLPGGLPILCNEGIYYPSMLAGFVTMFFFHSSCRRPASSKSMKILLLTV
ncbi:MAG: hypothetical protein JSU60_04985, partial [Nitrospirota bacterium]